MSQKAPNPVVDVRTILDDEILGELRAAYDLPFMLAAARHTLGAPYPPAAPWATYITEAMFQDEFIDARLRESVIISTLLQQGAIGPLMVHFYWGLMSGLTAQEIASIITLTGTYSGVDNYTTGIRLFSDTLYFLRDWAQGGQPLDSKSIGLAMLNSAKG